MTRLLSLCYDSAMISRIQRLSKFGNLLLPFCVYFPLSILATWPLAAQLGERIPVGVGGDAWVHWWTFAWVQNAIEQGQSPYFTDMLFYPNGISLTTHSFAWLGIGFWLPLRMIVGPIAAYGLVYLLIFTLNGCAAYWLAREWSGSVRAALVGGVVYSVWPYILSRNGHPNLIALFGVPLALLYLHRLVQQRRLRDLLLAAFSIALTGFAGWHLLIMGSISWILFLLYALISQYRAAGWKAGPGRAVMPLIAVAILSLLLLAPLAWTPTAELLTGGDADAVIIDQSYQGIDLVGLVVPNTNLWLWRDIVEWLPESLHFTNDRVDFLGYTVIALAVAGLFAGWHQARLWLIMSLIYAALAAGSQLHLANQTFPNFPMPYRLVEDFFLVRLIRNPHRFHALLGLPVSMLCTVGFLRLTKVRAVGRYSGLLLFAVGGLIVIESWFYPYRTEAVKSPSWYTTLAQAPEQFAILDLPMHARRWDKNYMSYQLTHNKPLVQGHVSRMLPQAFEFLESSPFLKELRETNMMNMATVDITNQLRTLADANVRYLILHKAFATTEQLSNWRKWLAIDPLYEDDELLVYHTQPSIGEEFTLSAQISDEIGLIDAAFGPPTVSQASIITATATVAGLGLIEEEYDLCLQLRQKTEVAQSRCQPLGGTWPTSQWAVNEIARSAFEMPIDPYLAAGNYALELVAMDRQLVPAENGRFPLGTVSLSTVPRTLDQPIPTVTSDLHWGQKIALVGYDLAETTEAIKLTLYWRALMRMENSYKVFVHLIDLESGTVVAQHDAVPLNWAYPTKWWEVGEVVADQILLPLNDVDSKKIEIQIGLYNELSGERLMLDSDGETQTGETTAVLRQWSR